MPSPRLKIGAWLADTAANELVRDGEAVRVEPKMMEVLVALAERPGEAVSRDDLLERIWPGTVVTDDALSGTVSKLRRVLGDDSRNPAYIETIPRTGYRLVAPVTEATPTPHPIATPPTVSRGFLVLAFGLSALAVMVALVLFLQRAPTPEPTASVRPITRAAGIERYPALDPSGQRLAFAARDRDSMFYHLFVQHLDAESPLQLTDARANDILPVWRPDGQALAFLRCVDLRCGVYTLPVPGGTPRRRTETTVSPYGLAWAPDADAVIVVDRDTVTAPYQLLRLNLATGERQVLTTPPDGALGDLIPAAAPDGSLAFVRHSQSGVENLYLLPPDRTTSFQLTDEEGRIRGFGWAGDHQSLLFSARREGAINLWRVPRDGDPIERAALPALRDPGSLTTHTDRAVIESWTLEVNLWEATPIDSGDFGTRPLVVSTAADREPALSPDGSRLAFISDRSGTNELWVTRRDGSEPLRLTDFGGAGLGAPAWFPDGRRIAFEVQRDGHAAIYTVESEGGTLQPLTDAEGYDVAPRPSRDGYWVYFGSDRTGTWQVWKVPTEGGPPVQVTTDKGFAAMESPDGATLYFTRYFEPGLWARPVEGGPVRLVTDRLSALDWGNWAATEAGLFWVDRTEAEARVLRLDPETETLSVAFDASNVPLREVGLTATPDGRTLVVARTERIESDLVLIERSRD